MSVRKDCGVCGGRVQPVDGKSDFGYCVGCGLVYLVKLNTPRTLGAEENGTGGGWYSKAGREPDEPSGTPDSFGRTSQSGGSRWRCPDCGTVLTSEAESDLGFLKVAHIREYHPNRPT